jgi:multiple sugar transport system ATP-binding protein
MAEIALSAVSKSFGEVRALADVTLHVANGEFVVLLGPTGAGKTTLLRLIAGLETADAGSLFIGGRDVTQQSPALRDVAFVFQRYSLYPHLSVFDNLAFPLRAPVRRLAPDVVRATVEKTAALVRIAHKLQTPVTKLSGGEMQRVAIGRALVRQPSVYLMDEPLSSLDAKLRAELRLELKHIQRDLGATIVYVTHDQTEAMTMASRIGILDHGRLVQVGTAREIYENPVSAEVAARLGTPRINLIPIEALASDALPAAAATVGARTEHIRLAADPSGPGTVTLVEHLGNESHVHVELGGRELVCLAEPRRELASGSRVAVTLSNFLLFDRAGRNLDLGSARPARSDLVFA